MPKITSRPTAPCRLCLRVVLLCKSHLLPRSIYKRLWGSSANNANPNPYHLGGGKARQSSRQMQEYLLCEDCEARFRQRGEDWTLANCFRDGRFPLRESLDLGTTFFDLDYAKAYDTSNIASIDIDKLCYFGLSVFWRSAVHKWRTGLSTLSINLGPYEESLRRHLLDEIPFSDRMTLTIRVAGLRKKLETARAPHIQYDNGFHQYKFEILGIDFRLAVGCKIPKECYRACAIHSTERLVLLVNQTDADYMGETAVEVGLSK